MRISTKGQKAPTVTNLNKWGGVTNNENYRATKGFAGKTPDIYACDTSNQQPTRNSNFKANPNRGGIDYRLGGVSQGNENPRGFKQDSKPKAYKQGGV